MIDGDQLDQHSVSSLSIIQYRKYVPCINCHTIWYCLGLKICLYSHRMHAVYNYSTSQAYLLYVQIFPVPMITFSFTVSFLSFYIFLFTKWCPPAYCIQFMLNLISLIRCFRELPSTIYHFSISFKDVMPLCFLFHVDCMLWQILLL